MNRYDRLGLVEYPTTKKEDDMYYAELKAEFEEERRKVEDEEGVTE
jgi:hypothetical protein